MPPRNDDSIFMSRALALARLGEGETNPNPMVGCVVVARGTVLGEGYHARAGRAHAEAVALEATAAHSRGATLYVNLEPCVHHGRTSPCAPRLIEAGIARAVVAVRDPNPQVNGRGISLLRRHGIDVRVGVLGREAAHLNRRFIIAQRRQRPYVLLKTAMTLDGFVATPQRDSHWITSARERRSARRLRRLHDGVMVGLGTVLQDDPMLLPSPRVKRPFQRIVLDSRFRLPLTSRIVRTAHRSGVIVIGCESAPGRRRALERRGVTTAEVTRAAGRVDLESALDLLWRLGVSSVMVEGGSAILGSFLRERILDEVAIYRGGIVLGGLGSLPAFGTRGADRICDALHLARTQRDGSPRSVTDSESVFERWYPAS